MGKLCARMLLSSRGTAVRDISGEICESMKALKSIISFHIMSIHCPAFVVDQGVFNAYGVCGAGWLVE